MNKIIMRMSLQRLWKQIYFSKFPKVQSPNVMKYEDIRIAIPCGIPGYIKGQSFGNI